MTTEVSNNTSGLPDAKIMYDLWLYEGLSLRKIGRRFGRSRTTVWQAIRKVYGKDACSPRKQGMARVVAQEFGEQYRSLMNRARGIEGRYLTTRKENNLSKFQSIGFLDNFEIESTPNEPQTRLNLPLFLWFCDRLCGCFMPSEDNKEPVNLFVFTWVWSGLAKVFQVEHKQLADSMGLQVDWGLPWLPRRHKGYLATVERLGAHKHA